MPTLTLREVAEDYVLIEDTNGSVVNVDDNGEDTLITLKWSVRTGIKQADFDAEQDIDVATDTFFVKDRDGYNHEFRAYSIVKLDQPLWENDTIQFARLLCELMATQDNINLRTVAKEMDLSVKRVRELLDRADAVWQNSKESL